MVIAHPLCHSKLNFKVVHAQAGRGARHGRDVVYSGSAISIERQRKASPHIDCRQRDLLGDYADLLALNLENTGSHVVTVPPGLVPGSYFIEIQSTSDSRVSAKSRTFTIDKTATPPAINDVAVKLPPQSMPPAQRGKVKKSLVPGASY